MRPVYEFNNYKIFVNKWIKEQPGGGRGQLLKIAKALGIHTTLLSHTLRGHRDLTPEQAILMADYLGLVDLESDYFMALVLRDRSGNQLLKNKYTQELEVIKNQSLQVSKRTSQKSKLEDKDKALFYSSWAYSGLRQLSSIEKYQATAEIQEALSIPAAEFNRILNFLLETGLCIEANNRIKIGPSSTHLESTSPFIYQHHKNWRVKGFERHNKMTSEELMYTAPFSISQNDFMKIRESLLQTIQSFLQIANSTKPEKVSCLNIDLFDL